MVPGGAGSVLGIQRFRQTSGHGGGKFVHEAVDILVWWEILAA